MQTDVYHESHFINEKSLTGAMVISQMVTQ